MTIGSSPYFLFPPVSWWANTIHCSEIWLDDEETFRKRTDRNRYKITTANGLLQLSIPLQGGRSQRIAMKDVLIDKKQNWQKQHWGALFSAYGRAPFYEYYGPELETLIKSDYVFLKDFNRDAINWAAKKLKLATVFREDERPVASILNLEDQHSYENIKVVAYSQVFENRYCFSENLSIIDLLMNEGPASIGILKQMNLSAGLI